MTTLRQASLKSEAPIHQFFLFNPKFAGKKEGTEHLKKLYFYPAETDNGVQEKSVGLSEALVRFTMDFSPNRPCEYMMNAKRKHIFFQPEPGYWMIMIVNKDSQELQEDSFKCGKYGSLALRNILENEYQIFRMFHSSCEEIFKNSSVESLRSVLKHYWDRRIPQVSKRIEGIDTIELFPGLNFLPVDGNIFLTIQSIQNQILSTFSDIKSSVFYFEDYLVFNSLNHDDVKLTIHLTNQSEKVYLSDVEYFYKILSFGKIKFIFFSNKAISKEVGEYLENKVQDLWSVLSDQKIQSQTYDEMFKYIYYNNMNLAYKSSIKKNREIFETISQLKSDFFMSKEGLKEVYLRPKKDVWIVANYFAEREFYHVFDNKQNSLIEVNENFRKAKQMFSQKQKK